LFHIILFRPQIPPNTGNLIRLSANTGCVLHLIKPLGFGLDRKSVRRAGLDYGELAQVRQHPSLDQCIAELKDAALFSIETTGRRLYSDAAFIPGSAMLFGSEHRGLPSEALERVPHERQLRLPMRAGNRSLNLSNAVTVVVYEAWRQNGFQGQGRQAHVSYEEPTAAPTAADDNRRR
jgi:tRNA (cytidine/uridine-2'-O-)-methyltransferase